MANVKMDDKMVRHFLAQASDRFQPMYDENGALFGVSEYLGKLELKELNRAQLERLKGLRLKEFVQMSLIFPDPDPDGPPTIPCPPPDVEECPTFQTVYAREGRLKELPHRPGAVVDPLAGVTLTDIQKQMPLRFPGPPTIPCHPPEVLRLIDNKIAELEREEWASAKHQVDILRWLREELTK